LSYLPESKVFRRTGYCRRSTNRASPILRQLRRRGTVACGQPRHPTPPLPALFAFPAFLFIRSVVNEQWNGKRAQIRTGSPRAWTKLPAGPGQPIAAGVTGRQGRDAADGSKPPSGAAIDERCQPPRHDHRCQTSR